MTDRKKVINELQSQLDDLQKYSDADEVLTLTQDQAKGILSLLKEKEAKPVVDIADSVDGIEVGRCPSCDKVIVNKKSDPTRYCKFCGQEVTWNSYN